MTQMFASAIDADRCNVDCLHPAQVRPVLGRSLGTGGPRAVAHLFAVLADPSRVRILHRLIDEHVRRPVLDAAVHVGETSG